jgi:hypothetical protein
MAESIAGRENDPAGRVFKNMRIEWLKTTPARRLLDIMNGGYARALGVSCTPRPFRMRSGNERRTRSV